MNAVRPVRTQKNYGAVVLAKRGIAEEEVSRRHRGWPNDTAEQGADDGADKRVARSLILHLFATVNISGALEERIHSHGRAQSHFISLGGFWSCAETVLIPTSVSVDPFTRKCAQSHFISFGGFWSCAGTVVIPASMDPFARKCAQSHFVSFGGF